MKDKRLFTDQTVIVTGGTKGLGLGIAHRYLEAGATVIVCARKTPEELPNVDGNSALFFAADVRDANSSQQLIDYAIAQTGRLDVLINNAGGSPEVAAEKASPKFTSAIISLNLTAPAVLSQQAHAAMLMVKPTATADQKEAPIKPLTNKGSIVNIASVSAIRPSPGTAVYGAAKAGLVNLTRSLAQEWAPNIRVNVIIAGLAKTEAAEAHYGGQAGIDRIEQRMPMRRMASPEDIAKACFYLTSSDADYVSGATLEVHGGGEPPAFLSIQND